MEDLKLKIGVGMMNNIGALTAKKLIAHFGNLNALFDAKKTDFKGLKVPEELFDERKKEELFKRVEDEISFIQREKIKPHFFLDNSYPDRLKQCVDGPVVLFEKGNAQLNKNRMVSIVGTRKSTRYGESFTEKLIEHLADYDITIISGLAYGIDITAHRAALANNMPTIGVIAHGHQMLYPPAHYNTAQQMLEEGGLITEFSSQAKIVPANFVSRNRIIAGLADATIVIESAAKGGALITADLANDYNRDVFALPGNVNQLYSKGCNQLIKNDKAILISDPKDITEMMGWEKRSSSAQMSLPGDLSEHERKLIELLRIEGTLSIDNLCNATSLPMSQVSSTLLSLEFTGMIKRLPGKMYCTN